MSVAFPIVVGVYFCGLLAFYLTPRSKRWKGRHISLPLVRRFGLTGARRLWARITVVRLAAIVWFLAGGPTWPWVILFVVEVARDVDDWLYSDDDDRRKDRFRARVRLRMPAPVRLRAVERWSGA